LFLLKKKGNRPILHKVKMIEGKKNHNNPLKKKVLTIFKNHLASIFHHHHYFIKVPYT